MIAPIQTKLLLTGIELKVFNHLSEPKTVDTVAKAIEIRPENTRHFPDGLAANDTIRKKDDLYQNTAVMQEFLVEGSSSETQYLNPTSRITTIHDILTGAGIKSPLAA